MAEPQPKTVHEGADVEDEATAATALPSSGATTAALHVTAATTAVTETVTATAIPSRN